MPLIVHCLTFMDVTDRFGVVKLQKNRFLSGAKNDTESESENPKKKKTQKRKNPGR